LITYLKQSSSSLPVVGLDYVNTLFNATGAYILLIRPNNAVRKTQIQQLDTYSVSNSNFRHSDFHLRMCYLNAVQNVSRQNEEMITTYIQSDAITQAKPVEFVGSVSLHHAAPCSHSADVYTVTCNNLSTDYDTPSAGHLATATAAIICNNKFRITITIKMYPHWRHKHLHLFQYLACNTKPL